MNITNDIRYVGVLDDKIDLFEGQYIVPDGITYNSYVILDEKIAVMDSVERGFSDEWIGNIEALLDGVTPDYLIVSHMEPDHSSSIDLFAKKFPGATIVASAKAFVMVKNFFGTDFANRRIVVGEGDVLSLGKHTLNFLTAPMVHWPEVIVSYDSADKVLFSADGFGKFGGLETGDAWRDEARRYYIGIVGKYGAQVQNLLKKASGLDIEYICPLHGPVLSDNIGYYVGLYDTWSSYRPESDGVVIAYSSVYGNTRSAAESLLARLRDGGCDAVIFDLARCDLAEAVAAAFKYSKLVLASPTYNGDVFPHMRTFIEHLTERNYCGRTVGLIENGSWAPMAAKVMRGMLEGCKGLTILDGSVKITSAPDDVSRGQIEQLAASLLA